MAIECDFDNIELMETIQASFGHSLRENPMGEAFKDALRLNFEGADSKAYAVKEAELETCFQDWMMRTSLNRH